MEKVELTFENFKSAFRKANLYDRFSGLGLKAMYDYIYDYYKNYYDGGKVELNVYAVCCYFTEFESLEDFWKIYDKNKFPDIETIKRHTAVIPCDIGDEPFIIENFKPE